MHRSLLFFLGFAFASTSAMAQVTTNASFTRYFGDVTPIDSNFETAINGVLVTPDPLNVVNGVEQGQSALPANTSSVEFKTRQVFSGSPFNTPSLIAWTPFTSAVPTNPGDAFHFGTLTITNGVFFYKASFDVTFTTVSSDASFNGHTFNDTISYFVTPNLGISADDDADYIEVMGHPELGQPRVLEGMSGTVELWGKVGSLDPLFFANPTGGVVLVATAPVPEPSEWLLMLAGLAGMATVARSRLRSRG